MKSITINGSKRESVGKKSSRALRNAGEVPCVLYGGDTPVHFSAHESAFTQLVYTSNAHTVVIALNNGETYNAILQDIQFHPVTDAILHVDLYQLFDDKPVSLSIPVQFNGNPKGVKNGGRLLKNQRRLRVKALPANLPDVIEVEIDHLKIGDKLYIHELETNGYTFLHPENTVVGQVRRSRIFIEDIEDEEGVEGAEGTEDTEGETPDTDSGDTQE